ncbi:actin-like protein Arp4p [Gloeophyllum trabeum ATCC 11539]|uniref:Actin-like protein Arp4p n=1 Tax=Gloeophyllum trabeum (strain ATCC 11539 / FP-39264 / Madison 617) TaxID=670483 RepID=S7QJP8_GLOTA|nr:actin-like protein Arp4p [Gloeophyllum trabeum ATCC 11539]EPQ59552.1 actin-like protein Arp4p [Gloeophyllum trabeum ATCC 11539]
MVQYGGDEVAALVVDMGASSLRAGYAGDDTPKAIIPTSYGYITEPASGGDVTMGEAGEDGQPARPAAKMYIGQNGPSMWRANMEVANPIQNGMIHDFAPIPPLISHALRDVMRCNPTEHPVLVTEPAWNTPANRERMAEIMFEEFQVPAFYIANTGVLNAFAAGKGSALVVDIGQSMASVTPVVDGFVLRKGLQYSALPQLVHAHAKHLLTNPTQHRPAIQLLPHQLIASKMPVEPAQPPKFTLREDRMAKTTDSWRIWAESREVDEWIQSVAGVLDQGWNEQAVMQRPPRQYEFPTGFNTYFGPERFSVGELYFNHSMIADRNDNLPRPLPSLITACLGNCDPDLRQNLLGNLVVTGGGSLFGGLVDRLGNELGRHFQVKIHAPGNPIERRYGGWLGGSILASLGTFHQLWISKEEWQDHGKAIVGQRCK